MKDEGRDELGWIGMNQDESDELGWIGDFFSRQIPLDHHPSGPMALQLTNLAETLVNNLYGYLLDYTRRAWVAPWVQWCRSIFYVVTHLQHVEWRKSTSLDWFGSSCPKMDPFLVHSGQYLLAKRRIWQFHFGTVQWAWHTNNNKLQQTDRRTWQI